MIASLFLHCTASVPNSSDAVLTHYDRRKIFSLEPCELTFLSLSRWHCRFPSGCVTQHDSIIFLDEISCRLVMRVRGVSRWVDASRWVSVSIGDERGSAFSYVAITSGWKLPYQRSLMWCYAMYGGWVLIRLLLFCYRWWRLIVTSVVSLHISPLLCFRELFCYRGFNEFISYSFSRWPYLS